MEIEENIKKCALCDLSKTRTNAVPGAGPENAEIMFIGEAPGKNEDLQGKPFVGRAGRLLDELLESVNLDRNKIYITNILKCRPPENRNPLPAEIETCTPHLNKQIEAIKPKVICTLGSFATKFILKKFGLEPLPISQVHGKVFIVNTLTGSMKIIPLYHPAYGIYDQNKKPVLFEDFKKIESVNV